MLLCESYVDITALEYRIYVEISVKPSTWDRSVPDCYIHKRFYLRALPVNVPNLAALTDCSGEQLTPDESERAEISADIADVRQALSGKSPANVFNIRPPKKFK